MAQSDLRTFVEDALLRYDPDIDLSDGSRAQSELVEPIMARVGTDPFDEDIETFIRDRVRQVYPTLAITEADELTDLLIDPMRVIIEPVVREIKLVKLRSSLRNIENLADDEVDALMGNFFEARRSGGYAVGVVRAYFASPQSLSLTLVNPASTRAGKRFFPTRPQQITADQMLLNVEGSEYYFDINYTAENRGDDYNAEPDEVVSIANLPTSTRIRNARRFRGGEPRETSLEYAARVQAGLSDKTLTVDRGIISTLMESFPDIRRIFSVGFRDPEMERDIIKGGSLGPIPPNDVYGAFYGIGEITDDLDADPTSPLVLASTGQFTSRVGAAGSTPSGWFLSVVYDAGSGLVAVDAEIVRVVSSTVVELSHEVPVLTLGSPTSVTWMLRRRVLTISDIPGGITLPDSAGGTLEITADEVHIGGKTDVYVAGETEDATSQITSLTDETPLATGINAETSGTSQVVLRDVSDALGPLVEPGMSLVIEEGADVGSYRILRVVEVVGPPYSVVLTLDTVMTGTQANLLWRVVDDIDVELTDPKNIKVSGGDLVTSAGSNVVVTTGSTNFLDANVQVDDILQIQDDLYGGDFTVTEVGAVSLKITPVAPRSLGAAAYRVFTRSEAVDTPVVRIVSLELLDSSGAPSGTQVPYRDPVLVISNAFQNEGGGLVFDGLVDFGLRTVAWLTTAPIVVGGTLGWEVRPPESGWTFPVSGTLVVPLVAYTPASLAALINADSFLQAAGVSAVVISTGTTNEYVVGFVSASRVDILASTGTVGSGFGLVAGLNNIAISARNNNLAEVKLRAGDIVEVVDGNNSGTTGRFVESPVYIGSNWYIRIGSGPLGPATTSALYSSRVLRPSLASRIRVARPSVGSARVYYLAPTSAEFDYSTTRFSASVGGQSLVYIPDPDNTRMVRPAPPSTDLPNTGETQSVGNTLTDLSADFYLSGIKEGDLVDILYIPITGTVVLSPSLDILVGGKALSLRLGSNPTIQVSFPFDMPRQDVVDYINEQVGETIAGLDGSGRLVLKSSQRIEVVDATGNLSAVLGISVPTSTDHPEQSTYVVSAVSSSTVLQLATETPLSSGLTVETHYQIRRYVQRVSSTEMNESLDATGLYYVDVEMQGVGPGDTYNIGAGINLGIAGHRGDGYRLRTENSATSFSRAERLYADISRSIQLVGSPDDPVEAVQLSQQNVQVSYERSQLVDDVQSFADSDFQRVLCEEILVRHLLPHYVALSWSYASGDTEANMRKALETLLDSIDPGEALEVSDLVDVLRRKGAVSVFTPDPEGPTGRRAPLFVVVYHDLNRRVGGLVVTDFVDTVRSQRYMTGSLSLSRVSSSGIR